MFLGRLAPNELVSGIALVFSWCQISISFELIDFFCFRSHKPGLYRFTFLCYVHSFGSRCSLSGTGNLFAYFLFFVRETENIIFLTGTGRKFSNCFLTVSGNVKTRTETTYFSAVSTILTSVYPISNSHFTNVMFLEVNLLNWK